MNRHRRAQEPKNECRCTHKRTISGNRRGDCKRPVPPTIRKGHQDGDKNWQVACLVCGEKPTVHPTELCGPCCFGEADTFGGNW